MVASKTKCFIKIPPCIDFGMRISDCGKKSFCNQKSAFLYEIGIGGRIGRIQQIALTGTPQWTMSFGGSFQNETMTLAFSRRACPDAVFPLW